MRKYSIFCKIDGTSWDMVIEANQFSYSNSGVYEFRNTVTNEEWYFPVYRTVIKRVQDTVEDNPTS